MDQAYLLALHSIEGLGPVRLKKLLDYYQSPELIWKLKVAEIKKLGIPEKVALSLEKTRHNLDPQKYVEEVEALGIKWVTIFDQDYPKLLKEISDPPVVLFYKGNLNSLIRPTLAIVGTRNITGYGKLITEKFADFLANSGITIISGLAGGVDTAAHNQTVKSGGKTVAVLGGGLKSIFPPENTQLAKQICESGGAIVSEFSPYEPSLPGNFPARNRIISGLSIAVLITEAAEGSGSLITAKYALEQGRDVFAIPGPITSEFSKGPSLLIKQGARLVTEPEEILEEMGLEGVHNLQSKTQNVENLSQTEQKILEILSRESQHIDQLVRGLKMSTSQVSATLVKLEILGLVKNLGGGNYTKIC